MWNEQPLSKSCMILYWIWNRKVRLLEIFVVQMRQQRLAVYFSTERLVRTRYLIGHCCGAKCMSFPRRFRISFTWLTTSDFRQLNDLLIEWYMLLCNLSILHLAEHFFTYKNEVWTLHAFKINAIYHKHNDVCVRISALVFCTAQSPLNRLERTSDKMIIMTIIRPCSD